MKITMTNAQTGAKVRVKKGFSWTTFFFGGFVPLARGDWKWFFICFLTFGLAAFYLMFKYNEIYIESLEERGFRIEGAN